MLGQEPSRTLPRQGPLAPVEWTAGRRLGRLTVGLPAVGLVLLAGCASVADVTGTATQQDLIELRGEVAKAQQAAQRARSEAEVAATRAVDARLRSQGPEGERQLTALTRRLDGLTTSLTELVARVDELSARIDALGRQVRSGSPAGPAAAPRTAAPATPAPGPSAGASPGVGTPPAPATPPPPPAVTATPAPQAAPTVTARPATDALQPQDIYQAAYIDFSKGSYSLAIAGFREFLRRFPDHQLAGNAQYWIGESHFSLARNSANAGQADKATQELEQAVQELRKVVANYPRSEKAPTALYKEALALIELKQPAVAQQRLEYLVSNFPQAEETPLARERLAAIKTR